MADLRAKLGRIVEDITSLEVNTILCDGMTGEQMTDPRQALFDVGSEYIDVLRRLIPGYEPGAQGKLPAATLAAAIAGGAPAAAPVATIAPGGQRDLRQWALWAVLVAGVLALGGMAWALMRQLGKPPGDRED